MKKIEAELWPNECGGYFCSCCGAFYDDYYEQPPIYCERCGERMLDAYNMSVDKECRLSRDGKFVDFDEYPVWLKDLRNGRTTLDHLMWK